VAGLALSLLLGATVYLVYLGDRGPDQRDPDGPSSPSRSASGNGSADESALRADAAAGLLNRLSQVLQRGTRRQVVALAASNQPAAGAELATIRANVRALGVTNLSFRYVDEDGGRVDPARQRALGGGGWVANVQVTWRLRGFEQADSRMETTMTLVRTGRRAQFVSARGNYGNAVPLWMLDRVAVARSRRSLVLAAEPDRTAPFARLANQAVTDVRKVLPGWRGRLVVEVPSSQAELSRLLGADRDAYAGIAAVTTTADGSRSRRAPVHVFVNPKVFDPLGPRGSQIVMSHEATHVAVGAATSTMPTWLLEGFADYVALAYVDLPVTAAASQILAQVRKKGPPSHLPGRGEFDPENTALGASYEAAWLACRLLADEYGQRRLVEFYRQSDRLSSTTRPFRSVLHSDQQRFTRMWQRYLRSLAG
jgi:hypothetical protein